METKVVNFQSMELIKSLASGEVACFPTETVYGLAVRYDYQDSFLKLIKIKQRNPDKPFTLMLRSSLEIGNYAYVDDKIQKLIDRYMPGEITLLLKPKENLYPWVKLNSKYIGVRVSAKKEVRSLIQKVGVPLLVSSANISNFNVVKNFDEAYQVFFNKVPYIVKGEANSNTPSTIIICEDDLQLIREGNIKFEEIKKVWEG